MITESNLPAVCSATGGDHNIKFNGGNPLCIECGEYTHPYVQRVFDAHVDNDGNITVLGPR